MLHAICSKPKLLLNKVKAYCELKLGTILGISKLESPSESKVFSITGFLSCTEKIIKTVKIKYTYILCMNTNRCIYT